MDWLRRAGAVMALLSMTAAVLYVASLAAGRAP